MLRPMPDRLFRHLLALAAVAALCGCAAPPGAVEARAHLGQGDADAAERAAAAGLLYEPASPTLWRLRVRAAMVAGAHDRAASHYRTYRNMRGGRDDSRLLADMARTTLAQALAVPSPAVRARAIRIIEDHEIEPLARDVMKLIGDANHEVAAAAAVAVLRAHPQAPGVAARMLASHDPRARAIAAEGIARKAGARARSDIEPLLGDPEPSVRAAAARAMAAWRAREDDERITHIARGDEDPGVRAAAIRALADTGRSNAAATARLALASEQPEVRRAAAYALAALGDRRGLKRAVRSRDVIVALRAGAALWRLGLDDEDGLGRALRSDDPAVRVAALAEIARSARDREGLRAAGWMLPDPDPEVRLAAGRTLIALGLRDRGVRELEAALKGERDDLRVIAAGELARLGDARGTAALEELWAAADASSRRRAVRQHLIAGQPSAALADALADASFDIRLQAADAILRLSR